MRYTGDAYSASLLHSKTYGKWENVNSASYIDGALFAVTEDGKVWFDEADDSNYEDCGQYDVDDWENVKSVAFFDYYDDGRNFATLGVTEDGHVLIAGELPTDNSVPNGNVVDVVAVWNATAVLNANGTVDIFGDDYNSSDTSDWNDIVAIAAGYDHIVGLKSDGTLVATSAKKG